MWQEFDVRSDKSSIAYFANRARRANLITQTVGGVGIAKRVDIDAVYREYSVIDPNEKFAPLFVLLIELTQAAPDSDNLSIVLTLTLFA